MISNLFQFISNLLFILNLPVQLRRIGIVPPLATLLAKSPEVDRYSIQLDDIIVGAAPLGAELEDLLIRRFPGVKIRQGDDRFLNLLDSCFPQHTRCVVSHDNRFGIHEIIDFDEIFVFIRLELRQNSLYFKSFTLKTNEKNITFD